MVCIEDFTKQPHRKQAKCPYCEISACVKCTQTYLLGTHEDPHCLGCRRGWTREVMDTILLTTWINGEYKKHRENILIDRERSRLPAAQIIVERRKEAEEREPIRIKLSDEIHALEVQLGALRTKYYYECRRIETLRAGLEFVEDKTATKNPEERRVFIMPCPAQNCRGFLSQGYKCGVCDVHVCSECREVKGTVRDAPHTCNPDTVATVQRLKKECRGCPECGTNIFKIEGCDQMFCTHCNTPFSWTTGRKIVTGAIHNPHYFEYLRSANGGVMPRAPGDIPCLANLPNAWSFERDVGRKFPVTKVYSDILYSGLQRITHIEHVEIPRMTVRADDQDNTETNVQYLTGHIDQKRWKQLLQMKEKRSNKKDEIRIRYEAFIGVCIDIYGRVMNVVRGTTILPTGDMVTIACKEACEQLRALCKIFNEGLMEISKRYKCQVLQINDDMKIVSKKYETGRPRRGKADDSTTLASEEQDQDQDQDDMDIGKAPLNQVVPTTPN